MAAPGDVLRLIEKFDRNIDSYRSDVYNEAQCRKEFIDPFFKALGWDMDNALGYAEAYKDVIHEDSIKVGGATKAPDYCFRIGGVRKFFLEAKKPARNLKIDIEPAYQLRRYAWSAKLPLSILTDFEELSVYDCRVKPGKADSAAVGRIQYIRYPEYEDKWDQIAEVFSKEAILRGSFDKYAADMKGKHGTAEVDAAFLKEIESWREWLAKNLALRNPSLTRRELNFAVQRTIDRLIFLRIAEDRGIEEYGRLQALLNGKDVYERLRYLYDQADQRYNSGLFHFHPEKGRGEDPDELSLSLNIDDKVLKDIVSRLYYPDSPYEFSVLPADILGHVYEQFLGRVIVLNSRHQATVEEKPEVKKSGGVYYTPTYIVDYIVKHTVGKLLEGKTPKDIGGSKTKPPLRVLDPACGSGSFLIGAYQYLMDWHRDWYVADGTEKHTKEIYQGPGGDWLLTTSERKRILLNNIYGVDIDQQAVEVTKLSLLLKVLEGENQQTLATQLAFVHERALPDLGSNIKCGNSLIGPDFYDNQQMTFLDEEERYRINVFDWKKEFPDVFTGDNPGFDAVIGNPPYGALSYAHQLQYYRSTYLAARSSSDSYGLFLEKSADILARGALLGMIVQSAWVSAPSMSSLREMFVSRFKPVAFASMPYDVFNAYVDTVIVVAERLMPSQRLSDLSEAQVDLVVFPPRFKILSVDDFETYHKTADSVRWLNQGRNEFLITLSSNEQDIITRLNANSARFSDVSDVQRGVTPFHPTPEKPSISAYVAFTGTIRRYKLEQGEVGYIRYDQTLAEYKPERYFVGPRLLLRELISRQFRLQATYTAADFVTNKSMQSLLLSDCEYNIRYLLGLLNSRLLSWYFLATQSVGRRDDFPKIVLKQTRELPFRTIDFSNAADKAKHDQMVELVERMLALHKQLAEVRVGYDKQMIQNQIDATDRQIDRLVYELYELTDEEIKIVEGGK